MAKLSKYLFGGIVGAAVAVMVTPRKGSEMRRMLMGGRRPAELPSGPRPQEADTPRVTPVPAAMPEPMVAAPEPPMPAAVPAPPVEPEPAPEPPPQVVIPEPPAEEIAFEPPMPAAPQQPAEPAVEAPMPQSDVVSRRNDLESRIAETRRRLEEEFAQTFETPEQEAATKAGMDDIAETVDAEETDIFEGLDTGVDALEETEVGSSEQSAFLEDDDGGWVDVVETAPVSDVEVTTPPEPEISEPAEETTVASSWDDEWVGGTTPAAEEAVEDEAEELIRDEYMEPAGSFEAESLEPEADLAGSDVISEPVEPDSHEPAEVFEPRIIDPETSGPDSFQVDYDAPLRAEEIGETVEEITPEERPAAQADEEGDMGYLSRPVEGEPVLEDEAGQAAPKAEAEAAPEASKDKPAFDREAMRRRIEETRARLKAKAFDAIVAGESFVSTEEEDDSEGQAVDIDSESQEAIEQSLREED